MSKNYRHHKSINENNWQDVRIHGKTLGSMTLGELHRYLLNYENNAYVRNAIVFGIVAKQDEKAHVKRQILESQQDRKRREKLQAYNRAVTARLVYNIT